VLSPCHIEAQLLNGCIAMCGGNMCSDPVKGDKLCLKSRKNVPRVRRGHRRE
jgi:hypothetical protein